MPEWDTLVGKWFSIEDAKKKMCWVGQILGEPAEHHYAVNWPSICPLHMSGYLCGGTHIVKKTWVLRVAQDWALTKQEIINGPTEKKEVLLKTCDD